LSFGKNVAFINDLHSPLPGGDSKIWIFNNHYKFSNESGKPWLDKDK